jgi:hypothetical protein
MWNNQENTMTKPLRDIVPLSETSKERLGSYLYNAIPAWSKGERSVERNPSLKTTSKTFRNFRNRSQGIETAIMKLGGPSQWDSQEMWKKDEPNGPVGPLIHAKKWLKDNS